MKHCSSMIEISSTLKSCLSSNNLAGSNSMKRNVSFHKIEIREYERTLGDNPCVRSGPPIQLGWQHDGTKVVDFLEYEEHREVNRRSMPQMVLSNARRTEILREECGITTAQMQQAMRDINIIKRRRKATNRTPRSADKRHEAMEKAGRRMKRFMSPRNSKKQETEKLWRDAKEYAMKKRESNSNCLKRATSCDDMLLQASEVKTEKLLTQSCVDLHQLALDEENIKDQQIKEESTDEDDDDEWGFFDEDDDC